MRCAPPVPWRKLTSATDSHHRNSGVSESRRRGDSTTPCRSRCSCSPPTLHRHRSVGGARGSGPGVRGAADQQGRFQLAGLRNASPAAPGDPVQHGPRSHRPSSPGVLVNGRQANQRGSRELNVVATNNGHVAGTDSPRAVSASMTPMAVRSLCAKIAVGSCRVRVEELLHHRASAAFGHVAVHQLGREAVLLHGVQVTLAAGGVGEPVGDVHMGDPPVPQPVAGAPRRVRRNGSRPS